MPDTSTINLLINSGVAGVFALFALKIFDRFTAYMEKRDQAFLAFLEGERSQRMQVMGDAQEAMTRLIEILGRIDENARETNKRLGSLSSPTRPRKE